MTPAPWDIAALAPLPADLLHALLDGLGDVRVLVPPTRDRAGLHAVLAEAELVLGDWSSQLPLGAAEAALADRLAFVQQPSVGVEQVDLAAFAARGVPVANTAGANAVAVAEWCLGATFAVLRSLGWGDAEVRAGRWPQLEVTQRGSRELAGARVGLVGMGAIAAECAPRYAALGCPVAYWSPHQRGERAGARWRELDELVATSDILVVVVALGPQTAGLLDARRLALLPAQAVVVDAARGGIVDEDALAAAVESGRIAAAALDVFATEPLPAGSPLRRSDRILLSPHAAGVTTQSQSRIVAVTLDNLRRAMAGEPVRNVRNGADPVVRRRR